MKVCRDRDDEDESVGIVASNAKARLSFLDPNKLFKIGGWYAYISSVYNQCNPLR